MVSAELSIRPMRSPVPDPAAVERHWLRPPLAGRQRMSARLRVRIVPIPQDLRDAFAAYVAGVIAASLFFA